MVDSAIRVRYYSPDFDKRIHEAIPPLFTEIRSAHAIESEVFALRLVPSLLNGALAADDGHEREVYERDFLTRWPILNARTGAKIGKVMRTRSHRYCVAGTVAVVSGEGVEWYSTFGDQFATYDPDHRLGFLKALRAKGPALLAELCSAV